MVKDIWFLEDTQLDKITQETRITSFYRERFSGNKTRENLTSTAIIRIYMIRDTSVNFKTRKLLKRTLPSEIRTIIRILRNNLCKVSNYREKWRARLKEDKHPNATSSITMITMNPITWEANKAIIVLTNHHIKAWTATNYKRNITLNQSILNRARKLIWNPAQTTLCKIKTSKTNLRTSSVETQTAVEVEAALEPDHTINQARKLSNSTRKTDMLKT